MKLFPWRDRPRRKTERPYLMISLGPQVIVDANNVVAAYVNKDLKLVIWISNTKAFSVGLNELWGTFDQAVQQLLTRSEWEGPEHGHSHYQQ